MVYAIGIDGQSSAPTAAAGPTRRRRSRRPIPLPFPSRRPAALAAATAAVLSRLAARQPAAARPRRRQLDDRVNVAALRDITDDSGGRTEIIRCARDLDPGDRRHRRRTEQAVLPRLPVDRREGRPLALDPRRSARRTLPRARAPRLRRDRDD